MKISLFIVIGLVGVALVPYAAFAATLSLSPSTGTFTVNSIFSVHIVLDTQGAQVQGADVQYLRYSTSTLEVVDENTSLAGVQIQSGTLMSNTQANIADPSAGTISFSQVTTGNTSFAGSGTLATVRFRALAEGIATATIDFIAGSTADSNVASNGQDVLSAVAGGNYTLQALTNVMFYPYLQAVTSAAGKSFTISFSPPDTATTTAQFTATADSLGRVALPSTLGLAAGRYDITVSSPTYLSKKLLNYNVVSNISIQLPVLPAGDLNSDNIINSLDWSVMSTRWFSSDATADLNKDGLVNSLDWSVMSGNWFRTGE